jgi:uncharacterized protein YcaQ
MPDNIVISQEVARRFILGKQGLWPGRRWQGKAGADAGMRAVEHLQLDPLTVVARSHDLTLHSRVADYTPGLWETLAYTERRYFDWGGWLAVRPMDELPYWRNLMRRQRDTPFWRHQLKLHGPAIVEMREVLRERGTVANRDFEMKDRTRHDSYRGRKDSALALYYLWRMGEVMVHHRERFERVYALAEAVAPAELLYEAGDAETEAFMMRKLVAFHGLDTLAAATATASVGRAMSVPETKRWSEAELAAGRLARVEVDGWKKPMVALGEDAPLLAELAAGRVPAAWAPLGPSTREQVSFLAPLDIVSARGRAKALFDFEYVWEVYKPVHLRRFGYYVLPILWGDRLVARADFKLDRTTNTLVIPGLWLEDKATGRDPEFGQALARGLADLLRFLGADKLDARAVLPVALRKVLPRRRE